MTTQTWTSYAATQTYLTTELNALTDGSNKIGAAIDNTTDLALFMDVELYLASFTPVSPAFINLYLIPSVDGTNYEDGGDSVDPLQGVQKYTRGLSTTATAKLAVYPRIILPPGLFKLLLMNESGASLAASGNTLKYRTYSQQATA
jgi:hypothetical protein